MKRHDYCRGCYGRFYPATKSIKYCSEKCRKEVEWELIEARLLDTGAADWRLEQHRRRHPKYRTRRILLGDDKVDIGTYVNTMRELREERIKAAKQDDIDLDALIERDGGICYICKKKTDKRRSFHRNEKRGDMRNYPSINHVIPISRGGSHTWDNVRLACRSCNSKKGGRLVADGLK